MTLHIVMDFETLSLKENATLLALGAVAIDAETGEIKSEFYSAIDPRQQPNRDIDPSTVLWWLGRDKAAQDKITDACAKADQIAELDESYSEGEITALYETAAHRIDHVAQAFVAWHGTLGTDKIACWSNGAVDHAWLNNMLAYSGLKNPVPYYLQRDYRTLKALFPAVKADDLEGFIAHHALWDAKYQAKHLVKLLQHARKLTDAEARAVASTTLDGEDADAFIAAQATLVDEVVHG